MSANRPSRKSEISAQTTGNRQKSLSDLQLEEFDLIIVGGGITGATILWDATLRGLKVLLLEKNDYASGTSQATSKMIHGGLRYLKNFEFGLVRESLRERRILGKIAPHALRSMAFLIPIYKHHKVGKFTLGLGMKVYDLLSYDRNKGVGEELKLPPARFLGRTATLAEEKGLIQDGLLGSYMYYDYQNMNPERLCCEFIFSAREAGGSARNYTEVTGINKIEGDQNAGGGEEQVGYTVTARDNITGEDAILTAKTVVNASGPWADQFLFPGNELNPKKILRSKGIHIVTRRLLSNNKTVSLLKDDGSHRFIVPWRGKSLIGTTDVKFEDHPDNFQVTRKDIEGLLEDVNSAYSQANLTMDDVEFYYGGLRPLVDEGKQSTYNASRRHEVMDHKTNGRPGFYSVLGGKYTTSRGLAENVLDLICDHLPGNFRPCETATRPLMGGHLKSLTNLEKELIQEFPGEAYTKIQALCGRYGSLARRILQTKIPPALDNRRLQISGGEFYYPEELVYLIENEDIHFISDLYFRRAGLGVPGKPAETVNRLIVEDCALLLGWDQNQKREAMEEIDRRYKIGADDGGNASTDINRGRKKSKTLAS